MHVPTTVMTVALTVLLTQGSIFHWFRVRGPDWWQELVSCPLCLGWWIGAGATGAAFPAHGSVLGAVCAVFGHGALVGVAALLTARLIGFLDR